MSFEGKTAIITGAGSGIGRQAAEILASKGCKVLCMDINGDVGGQVVKNLNKEGMYARFYRVDMTDEKDVDQAVESILKDYGRIDILVHSAGITAKIKLKDLTLEAWEKTLKINLTGTFIIAKAVSRPMIQQKYGRIVILSSGSAITGTGGGPHYAASKAGQIGLTRSLSNELAPFGITVNAIGPRSIETPLLDNLYSDKAKKDLIQKIPIGRLGTPKDVADLAVFLASDESGFITGQFILIDGGRTYS